MAESPLPGLEEYFVQSPFPAEYTPNFLTPKEADDFFSFFNDWHYCDFKIVKSGLVLKRKGVAFAADPNHTQVRGTKASGVTYGAMDTENDDDDCNDSVLPLSRDENTPAVLRSLQEKLTAKLRTMAGYEQRTVNYLSVVRYSDETVGINWHKHSEDNGVDTPVLIVSVGAVRPFHLRLKDRTQKWEQSAGHGSLIVLPSSFNDTHEHAILKEKHPCEVRISVNTKCLIKPKVFSLKDGWGHYPRWAVYVGCRYEENGKLVREGTPYGNGSNPLVGRAGAITTEAAFRKYVAERMSDSSFRARALDDLRGKHLLCWCRQSEPDRAEFCHARVWLEAVNQQTAKSASSSGK